MSEPLDLFRSLFLDHPIVLFLLVFVAAASALQPIFKRKGKRRNNWQTRNKSSSDWRSKKRGSFAFPKPDPTPIDVAANHLRIVTQARFNRRPLLNKKELRVFAAIERLLDSEQVDWRVMAQVSLGEIVSSPDDEAYKAINSKRVDLLIVDGMGIPLHAIEYQGAGHHQGTAAVRDAVKKEALRRAGIGYEEVNEGDTIDDLKATITKLVRKSHN